MTSSKISSAPCFVQSAAQRLQELGPLQQQAVVCGHGLDDEGGDAVPFGREQLLGRVEVVERQHARQRRELARDALRRRLAERRETRAGCDEQVIDVAVIAAREFHDEIAARRAAREAHGAHDGFGSRRYEPNLLDAGIGRDDLFGELDLGLTRCAVRHAAPARALDGRDDLRVRMTQDQRAPRADEVEILAAVGIRDHGAGRRPDHERCASDAAERAHGRVHAARRDFLGALEPRLALLPSCPSRSQPFAFSASRA